MLLEVDGAGKSLAAGRRAGAGEQGPTSASERRPAGARLPIELAPFARQLPPAGLTAAAERARGLGVGGDEVLVASQAVGCAAATDALAAHLGLAVADPATVALASDAATAKAVLRTGVAMEPREGERLRFTMAVRGREIRRLVRALKADPDLRGRVRLLSPRALRRAVAAAAGESLTRDAAFAFLQARPEQSAGALRPGRPLAWVAAVAGLPLLFGLAFASGAALAAVQSLLSLLFLAWIALRLAGCLYPPQADGDWGEVPDRALPVYSILVPLYREAASVPGLVAALRALDYPVLCSKLT